MLQIKRVHKFTLRELVEISYSGDFEGFKRFHVEEMDYRGCVEKTLNWVDEVSKEIPLRYYGVYYDEEPIGYLALCDELLYSFCVKKEYRTKRGLLNNWWELVKGEMGETFACLLPENNTRAINFLVKKGMNITGNKNNLTILLWHSAHSLQDLQPELLKA